MSEVLMFLVLASVPLAILYLKYRICRWLLKKVIRFIKGVWYE